MKTIYTIGHSTRTIEQFIALLTARIIQEVVDVRALWLPLMLGFRMLNALARTCNARVRIVVIVITPST
jgi:hypothetical protein